MKKIQNWKTRLTNLKTKKIKIMKHIFNIMRDLIRTILLIVAIYFGAIAVISDDINIVAASICGVACSGFVITNDKK